MKNLTWLFFDLSKKVGICLIVFSPSLLSSCLKFKEPEFLSMEHIKFEQLGFSSSTLSADLHFFNPNGIGVSLGHAELDVYVNQSSLGHISKDINVHISRKSKFVIPVSLNLDLKNLLMTGITAQLRDKSQVRILGSVQIKKGAIQKKMAVDYTTEKDMSLLKM